MKRLLTIPIVFLLFTSCIIPFSSSAAASDDYPGLPSVSDVIDFYGSYDSYLYFNAVYSSNSIYGFYIDLTNGNPSYSSGVLSAYGIGRQISFTRSDVNSEFRDTKLYKGYNRPVSNEKVFEKGLTDGRTVYNLSTWSFGFSTCIKLTGDRLNTAFYITKYITKDCKKIFGKFFWHSRSLEKPKIIYEDIDYDSVDSIECNGFKYVFTRSDTDSK